MTTVPYHRDRSGRVNTVYGYSWAEIVQLTVARVRDAGPLISAMAAVRDRYNAEWVLPGFEDDPEGGGLAPMLIADAIDNLGMLAAQVDPTIDVPAIDPSKASGMRSLEYANVRRKMITATHYSSAFDVGRGRAYRHLAGYATFSLVVVPDFRCDEMRVQVRNPLATYCEPHDAEDLSPPGWVCFVYGKSAQWVRNQYPATRQEQGGPIPRTTYAGSELILWDLAEWWDGESNVIGLIGPRTRVADTTVTMDRVLGSSMELQRLPNRFGMVPAVCPSQVTLDRVMSAVHRIVGSADLMAKFRALDLMAAERSIFPDRFIVGANGQAPRMVAGQWLDGRTGETNLIMDATSVGNLHNTVDPSGPQAADRLEGEARRHAGMVPQMQGQSSGALRTGRAIDSLYGTAVDPRAAEFHRIMQHALVPINKAILAGYKGYFGDRKFSMFSGRSGDGNVSFTPNTHVEVIKGATYDAYDKEMDPEILSLDNAVVYPIPGADVLNTTMALGQLIAMKAISRQTMRRMHPWVPDYEAVEREIMVETLEEGLSQALIMRFQSGIPPEDAAKVIEILRKTGDIVQATQEAQKLAEARQAKAAQPALPDQTASPDQMPGLANPGEGAEQLPAEVAPPNQSQMNLKSLDMALKQRPPTNAGQIPTGVGG